MRLRDTGDDMDVPAGLDPWFLDAIRDLDRENEVLRRAGAGDVADIREFLLTELLRRAEAWLSETVPVAEAARVLGVHEETVRRAIRCEQLPATRRGERGKYEVARKFLKPDVRKKYDPVADAQDIAKLRGGI